MSGSFWSYYNSIGAEGSALGLPLVAASTSSYGTPNQRFANGIIYVTPRGTFDIRGAIFAST